MSPKETGAAPALAVVRGDVPKDEQPSAKLQRVIEQLNREFALVLIGNSYVVLQELPEDADAGPFRLLSLDAFKLRFRPARVWRGDKMVSYASAWLDAANRRAYEGITFAPGQPREVAGYYNLWRGWGVTPDPAPQPEHRCGRFLAHVRDNVCSGDLALYAWVIAWLAHLVQHPAAKVGTALVLQGAQGTGKTMVHEALRRIVGPHVKLVSSIERVTGRFNAHLTDTLLLTLDEATWGGDHAAAGRLKDLVTGADHLIEFKGREPIRVRNYTRLLVTSNNAWVVPAGESERRFAVLRVGEHAMQDRTYFRALVAELDAGGAAALLAYLLAVDLTAADAPDPSHIPTTAALHEQQIAGLSNEAAWWRDVLERGCLPGDREGGAVGTYDTGYAFTRASAMHAAYIEHARALGSPRRSSETQLGGYLHRVVPGLQKPRLTVSRPGGGSERTYVYRVPPLRVCRTAFAAQFARHADVIAWPDPDADWAPDPHAERSS